MLGVLAGNDGRDATSSLHPVADYAAEMATVSVGAGIDSNISLASIKATVSALNRLP